MKIRLNKEQDMIYFEGANLIDGKIGIPVSKVKKALENEKRDGILTIENCDMKDGRLVLSSMERETVEGIMAVDEEKLDKIVMDAVYENPDYHNSLAEDTSLMRGCYDLLKEKQTQGMSLEEAVGYIFRLMEKEFEPYRFSFPLSKIPTINAVRIQPDKQHTSKEIAENFWECYGTFHPRSGWKDLYGWIEINTGEMIQVEVENYEHPNCIIILPGGARTERSNLEIALEKREDKR